jgi:hypothetical protein
VLTSALVRCSQALAIGNAGVEPVGWVLAVEGVKTVGVDYADFAAKGFDGGLPGFHTEGIVGFGFDGFATDGEWAFRSRGVG